MTGRAIVIGAGVSGLAAGILLARSGWHVRVLEQHTIAGGLMQRFTRRSVSFESGFHYLGSAAPGGALRRYLSHLGLLDRIELTSFAPDGFDVVHCAGRVVRFPQGRERIVQALLADFPAQSAGIHAWFAALDDVAARHPMFSFADATVGLLPHGADDPTVAAQLGALLDDPLLCAALAAHCMLYGVGAHEASLEAHALVTSSFYHSAHGVVGGGAAFSAALVDLLAEAGGELLLRTDVTRILTEGRRVTGVATADGELHEADCVVSSAHPKTTLGLLPPDAVPARHVAAVEALTESHGALLLHCVARGIAPVEARRNRFVFADPSAWSRPVRRWFADGSAPDRMVILESPVSERAPGDTVFQVLVPMRTDDLPDLPEPARWDAHKREAARRTLDWVERIVPAWAGRVDFVNASTPRAVARYVRSHGGSCFGAANLAGRTGRRKLSANLGLHGLSLTGQSVGLPGILGSLVSAYIAAGSLVGGPDRFYTELLGTG